MMNQPPKDLQAILRKIQALRARAADAASTEAEAEIATRKAAELLAQHNISLSEIDVRAEGVERQHWDSGQQTMAVECRACHGIEKLCNVKTWRSGGVISILGAPADVATALYFLDIVRAAVRSTWVHYQKSGDFFRLRERGQTARTIGHSFRMGVAVRIGQRMAEMAKQAADAPTAPISARGNALVVVKNSLITQWMVDNKLRLRTGSSSGPSSGSAFAAGSRAGDAIGLNRGLGSRRATGLLK